MTESLGEAFPKEQARVRDLALEYAKIPSGGFGLLMINKVLADAESAAMSGDLVLMVQVYERLKECQ